MSQAIPETGDRLDPALFRAEAISEETRRVNEEIIKLFTPAAQLVGGRRADRPRLARARGGPFSPRAEVGQARAPSQSTDREALRFRCVLSRPPNPRGVYLHIHGGGMVLGAADLQDQMLDHVNVQAGPRVRECGLPPGAREPLPCCARRLRIGCAVWLAKNAKAEFGVDVLAIGGESAGATLAAVTLLRMRDRHGFTGFRAANLVYGAYDLSMTPSQKQFGNERLVLRTVDIEQFMDAYLPGAKDMRHPDISPLYADLKGLPPALFTVGTRDGLLDDSLFMHARYIVAGNRAELAVYPGGAHAFNFFRLQLPSRPTRAWMPSSRARPRDIGGEKSDPLCSSQHSYGAPKPD
jgi:acetyl esterase